MAVEARACRGPGASKAAHALAHLMFRIVGERPFTAHSRDSGYPALNLSRFRGGERDVCIRFAAGMRHRPCSLTARARRCPFFLSPKRGMERREAPGGLRGPLVGRPLRSGPPCTPFGSGVMSPAPGAPPPCDRGCCASRRSIRFERARVAQARPRCTGCLPARRSAAALPRLETGEDHRPIKATYSYIGRIVKRAPRACAAPMQQRPARGSARMSAGEKPYIGI